MKAGPSGANPGCRRFRSQGDTSATETHRAASRPSRIAAAIRGLLRRPAVAWRMANDLESFRFRRWNEIAGDEIVLSVRGCEIMRSGGVAGAKARLADLVRHVEKMEA